MKSFIREAQRFQSMMPMRQITTAAKALDMPEVRHIRAMNQMVESATKAIDFPAVRTMDQIAQSSIGALDTLSAQHVRTMEQFVPPSLAFAETMKVSSEVVEAYRRYEQLIPTFVDEAVRNARKFNQLIGVVETGIESIAAYGSRIESMVNQASVVVSSIDLQAVRERLAELLSEGKTEVNVEAEIEAAAENFCGEIIDNGSDFAAVLMRMEQHLRTAAEPQPKIRRRDAILDSIVGTVLGGWILKLTIDATTTPPSHNPPSNLDQQSQRKAHRGKPDRGEPNRGKSNRAEPNRGKPNDGKPADKQQKPKP